MTIRQSRLQRPVVLPEIGTFYVSGEDMIIINVYVTNNRASKYIKEKLTELKAEINITLSVTDRIFKGKNKEFKF